MSVRRREIGAGVVAAVAALVASLVYHPALGFVPLGLSPDAKYWFGYAPQFATLAGSVVGTVVWRRAMSRASTPQRGALVGIVTAVGTVLSVPILAGLYVILFPLVSGLVTGEGWSYIRQVLPTYVRAAAGVVRTVAVSWSPLVGLVLVPCCAFIGWASQRGHRPRSR